MVDAPLIGNTEFADGKAVDPGAGLVNGALVGALVVLKAEPLGGVGLGATPPA
jgi:hypothetical protein